MAKPMKYVEALNRSLHSLFARDRDLYFIGEDILDPYGGAFKVAKGLSTHFPDRVIATPISEAGIIGFGIGMALQGFKPILEIMFGDFIALGADQIVNCASKFSQMYDEKVRLSLVLRTPMGGRRGYGPTHSQTLETLFLSVPNVRIVAPSHFHNPGELLEASIRHSDNLTIFIENKLLYATELQEADQFEHDLLTAEKLYDGDSPFYLTKLTPSHNRTPDVMIICYGGMAPIVLEAVESAFFEEEIEAGVIIPSLIKPLQMDFLLEQLHHTRCVLVAEEGVQYAGWGAELVAQLAESREKSMRAMVKRVGSKSFIIPSSKPLEDFILPQAKDIFAAIKECYESV
jgi:pyruvate/2-oxoglutarate/acetoin dehydrogenase E1 component